MKIHYLQHVPFEGLGCIQHWITKNNHQLTATKFYESAMLPNLNDVDFLIIMGGPMGVYDEDKYKWLAAEKEFIRQTISAGKNVLGICLGAQLIAEVLGAKVYPNKYKEIGWFSVNIEESLSIYSTNLTPQLTVFHWHGDTFDLPKGATLHSSSLVCKNQLFTFNDNVMGIQFHLEATAESIKLFVENGKEELIAAGDYVQSELQILGNTKYIAPSNQIMFDILDKLTSLT